MEYSRSNKQKFKILEVKSRWMWWGRHLIIWGYWKVAVYYLLQILIIIKQIVEIPKLMMIGNVKENDNLV